MTKAKSQYGSDLLSNCKKKKKAKWRKFNKVLQNVTLLTKCNKNQDSKSDDFKWAQTVLCSKSFEFVLTVLIVEGLKIFT